MQKTAEILGMPRFPCIAHGLHNNVKSALASSTELQVLTTKCHKLTTFFHASPKMAQALQREQELINRDVPPVVVIIDVVTRWNSILLMLRRLLKLRMAIESLQFVVNPQQQEDKVAEEKLTKLRLKAWEWEQV